VRFDSRASITRTIGLSRNRAGSATAYSLLADAGSGRLGDNRVAKVRLISITSVESAGTSSARCPTGIRSECKTRESKSKFRVCDETEGRAREAPRKLIEHSILTTPVATTHLGNLRRAACL